MHPIIYIIAGGALLMHYAKKKPSAQNTATTIAGVIDTQVNHGTQLSYDTNSKIPNFAAGYDNRADYTTQAAAMNGYNPTTGQPYKGTR